MTKASQEADRAAVGRPASGSEQHFRLLADNAPVMIWRAGPDKLCDYFNRPWLDFTGRSMEQEIGTGWTEGVHPDDRERCIVTFAAAFEARQAFSLDYRLRRHDGVYRWVLGNGRPYRDAAGTFAGYFGTCIDVTDLKEAEERARRTVATTEALVQELHHRVKNDMQLILSLLRLQSRRVEDDAARGHLERAANRIQSIALAQMQVSAVAGTGEIELGGYLRDLAASLRTAYGRSEIDIEVETDSPLVLPAQRAVPLGLIANELIANALIHAFPSRHSGRIVVSVARAGDSGRVTIADDGIGLAPDKYPGGGLGFQLAAGLAGQARGRITVDRGEAAGTRFTVEFPLAAD